MEKVKNIVKNIGIALFGIVFFAHMILDIWPIKMMVNDWIYNLLGHEIYMRGLIVELTVMGIIWIIVKLVKKEKK